MGKITVPNCGSAGVIKDLSAHELPPQAWADARNVRFIDGSAQQFYGYGQVYGAPAAVPLHVLQLNIGADVHWLYASANRIHDVSVTNGIATHRNVTRQAAGADVPYKAVPNAWTSTTLSGIPILNNGIDPPQRWDLGAASRFQTLDAWPAGMTCKSLRAFGPFLVALNVTKNGTALQYMVKWSSPADPGGVPVTWNEADATQDAGEFDLAEGGDYIVDGLQLGSSFMIYKQRSIWRMDQSFNSYVFSFRKVLGTSGAMNRNCIVELDGLHFVLTNSDVIVHDGQSSNSVLDHVSRRALFAEIDTAYVDRCFVFKNPFFNEVYVCYAAIGSTVPNRALVWNYVDKTVTFRDMPNVNHAAFGSVDNSLGDSWSSDSAAWDSDLTPWNGPDFTPGSTRVLMASADNKLLLLDASASADGQFTTSYLERRGMSFGDDTYTKRISGVRLRVSGNVGKTVVLKLGGHQTDPYADPEYPVVVPHVIGQTIQCDGIVDYRYPAIRIESGTAATWRLDSFDYQVQNGSMW